MAAYCFPLQSPSLESVLGGAASWSQITDSRSRWGAYSIETINGHSLLITLSEGVCGGLFQVFLEKSRQFITHRDIHSLTLKLSISFSVEGLLISKTLQFFPTWSL